MLMQGGCDEIMHLYCGRVRLPEAMDATHGLVAEGEDILDVIKAELGRYSYAAASGLPRFAGGAVGYLGYDVVRFFERLPETAAPALDVADRGEQVAVARLARQRRLEVTQGTLEVAPAPVLVIALRDPGLG